MADEGAPADFGGRVLPNPSGIKPVADTDIEPEGTYHPPKGAKLDTSNPPADPDKANGITPHPLQQHFQKKGSGVRKTGSPVISDN